MTDGPPTTLEDAEIIWTILQEECGAPDTESSTYSQFIHWLCSDPYGREFRFMGRLGFGGKFYWDGFEMWVDYYSEDQSAERDAMVAAANARLGPVSVTYTWRR